MQPGDLRTGLLVIDMQANFLRAMADGEAAASRTEFALHAARIFGLPVYFTEQAPDKLGPTLPHLREAAPQAPLFDKLAFSAWAVPELRTAVAEARLQHLLLCGLETGICVYQTALGILRDGLGATLLTDCLTCRRPADGHAALRFLLARTGASCLPSESVFYALLETAASEHFKTITALVKRFA